MKQRHDYENQCPTIVKVVIAIFLVFAAVVQFLTN